MCSLAAPPEAGCGDRLKRNESISVNSGDWRAIRDPSCTRDPVFRVHTRHCQNNPLSHYIFVLHGHRTCRWHCPIRMPHTAAPYSQQVNHVCRDEMRRFAVARSSALGLLKAIAFAYYACTFFYFFDTTLPSAPGKRGPKTPAPLPSLFPEGRSASWLGHAHVACPRRCKVSVLRARSRAFQGYWDGVLLERK